jgi:Icc-related predicted phosphoesterase
VGEDKMSEILICGDWHGNHVWAKKIIEVAHAEGFNKIIQVGDFGVWPGKEGREYLLILSRFLMKKKVNLYFVPGNHEDYNQIDEWNETLPKNRDGHIEVEPNLFYAGKVNSWEWEGKKFASVGGAYSIDRKWRRLNESWWRQETLTDEEENAAVDLGKVNYLFSHDCPSYHPFKHLKVDYDSEIHRQRMTRIGKALQPYIWFHGHMHDSKEYPFDHQQGVTKVYALDADNNASDIPRLNRHTKVLNTDLDEVYNVDKLFNWYGREFYFDRKHGKE